jgi:hypothetical protein
MPTFPVKNEVADDWNIVVPGDYFAAPHAMGAGLHHRPAAWPAVDTDVQKTADDQAEQERENGFDQLST